MIRVARKIIRKIPQLDYISYLIHNSGRIIYDSRNMRSKYPRPRNIMIEPTNVCNLRCYMCNAKDAKRQKGFMAIEVYKHVLDQALQENAMNLVLHTVGESLMHPSIVKMIRIAKSKGFCVHLSSNGMLLNSSFSKVLIESGLDQFRFSIEGATKKTYERIRQGANFDRLLENMRTFKEIRDKYGNKPNITIGSIIMKETESEVEEFFKIFSSLADYIEFSYLGNQGGQVNSTFCSSSIKPLSAPSMKCQCKLLWSTVVILWNGDVSCCCIDFDGRLIVGNIMNESLHKIWTSEKYNRFRRLHKLSRQDEMEMCGSCSTIFNPAREFVQFKLNRRLKRLYEKA